MKKFKIIFLAKNNYQNLQINNIIENLKLKNLHIEIIYTQNSDDKKKNIIFNYLINFIFCIEKKFLNKNKIITYNKINTIKKKNISLDLFEQIYLDNNKKNNKYITDVIIDLSNHNLSFKIINCSRLGVWFIDYRIKNIFFIGFWECLLNYKIASAYMIIKKYKNKKLFTSYVDVSFLNNKINFWIRNKEFVKIKSSNLISKNLNKIFYNLKIKNINKNKPKVFPEVKAFDLIRYICVKYFFNLIKRILDKFTVTKDNFWKIYIKETSIQQFKNNKDIFQNSKKLIPINNFEWADPFVYDYKNKTYIFFENNNLKSNCGKISCGLLRNDKLVNIKDILSFNYHLSYPFIWRCKKNIFLIPETSQNKSIQIWKSVSFPYKWKLFKTIFKNQYCCDTTIITDNKKINWMLTNKSNDETNDPNNELYIYKIVGNFGQIIPHKQNPVITDCRIARNAGSLNSKNEILRPSQINDSSGYGVGLNINKILSLSLDTYKEKIIKKIYPIKRKNTNGLHHISNTKKKIVFDVREKNII